MQKSKILSILCATTLVGQGMPISAEEATINGEGTQSVTVTASVSPDYTVTIPKTLTLDKEGTAEYTVTASGEIEKLSTLTVTPDESFVLTAKYDSATAKVSQEKTSWSDTDLLTDSEKATTGTITVEGGLAPGEWSGTFNFEIALNEHECVTYVKNDESTHMCEACATTVEHVFTETIEEATCANEGTKTYTCDCGYSYSESIPAAGHTDNNSDEICDECGDEFQYTAFTLSADNYEMAGITRSGDVVIPKTFVYDGVYYKTTGIAPKAFYKCGELTSIVIPDSVTSIGEYAFFKCTALTDVEIPDSVAQISKGAFNYCESLTSIDIPDSVGHIGNNAFSGCKNLESVNISDSVAFMGDGAFSSCTSLTSVKIPDNLATVAKSTFEGCTSLASIEIPNSVTNIDLGAFRNCSSLVAIDIPDNLTTIGNLAFDGCTGLTNVTIPASVTSIGINPFSSCSNLVSITVDENNTTYDSRNNCNAIITTAGNKLISGCVNTIIPDDVTEVCTYAFYGCTNLTGISIPDSVTNMGEQAFARCSNLVSFDIPDGVTTINDQTFTYCSSLTSIVIPESITAINGGAFYGCNSITINYKGTEDQWGTITKSPNWNPTNPTINYEYTE